MLSNGMTTLLRPVLVAFALVLVPLAAMGQTEQKPEQEAAQGTEQRGDQITLTQQEAQDWELFPVVNQDGDQIGEVASLSLGEDGKVEELRVETGQALGIGPKTIKVQPDQFTTNGARIKLDMSNSEIQDLPTVEATQ